ncbi:MAG TPA: alpha/beta hydrolase [Puia sp.]|uniref:alpha/beta fold hydrolase n=1 Tax=Puia sp. TaxID=2045100 RepID=UPI002BD88FBC|nr:alpha/beta hydrolase [Puia sp.]HVU96074.1 alpha/beta hydrolase [Puia sp.]
MKKKRIKGRVLPWLLLPVWFICSSFIFKMREPDRAAMAEFAKKGVKLTFKTIEIGGIKLHYAKTGNDSLPTLFFIHGSPGSWTAYKRYLADTALLQHFRMIAIDRPGFGYSSFGHAFHLYEQSALIYNIVEQEDNGKPLHLIGHSLGGPIVVKLAQEHPNAYSSLTILSGSISPYDEPKEKWRGFFASGPFEYLLPGAIRTCNKEIWYFKKDLYKMDRHYDTMRMPVMFIHGDKDPLVTVKNVQYGMHKLTANNNAKMIIIPGANHFIPWEHYDIIKKHLLTLNE